VSIDTKATATNIASNLSANNLTLNACDLRQKNRMTLVEKKQKLIINGK
jgi:hypothetical protein